MTAVYERAYRILRRLWHGGPATRRHGRELERTQWLSRPELEAWQFEKVKDLIRHAYERVPFYRERYQREGFDPRDIKSWADFQSLPFLTREDITGRLDDLVARPWRGPLQAEWTGGSTGHPLHFYVEDDFWWWNAALEIRGRGWHGIREGEKIAWAWGSPRDLPRPGLKDRMKARLKRQRFLDADRLTVPGMEVFAQTLLRWRPAMIRAYPSTLTLFARFLRDRGIVGIRPRLVETSAEKVSEPQRRLFEEVFGCPVADCYSGRELGTIAYTCDKGSLHVCETRLLETIADEKTVQPGVMGEIAITSLHQYAMPLIRYKNGDLGVYETAGCPCGRGLPALREVVGRINDMLVTDTGAFVHTGFLDYRFSLRPDILRYQVYQPSVRRLEVRLVCRKSVSEAWREELRGELQARFGPTVEILIRVVDDIPLTPAGKHRVVISDAGPKLR